MKNLTSKIQWRSGVIALSTLALLSIASSSYAGTKCNSTQYCKDHYHCSAQEAPFCQGKDSVLGGTCACKYK